MASVALIVLPLAHLLVPGERMTLRRSLGFVIGFVGVCILIGGQAFEASGAQLETAGRIACIGAASCYGISSILMRRLPPVDPIGLSTVLLLIAALIVLPAAWIVEGPTPLPDTQTLAVIAFLGLIPNGGSQYTPRLGHPQRGAGLHVHHELPGARMVGCHGCCDPRRTTAAKPALGDAADPGGRRPQPIRSLTQTVRTLTSSFISPNKPPPEGPI